MGRALALYTITPLDLLFFAGLFSARRLMTEAYNSTDGVASFVAMALRD